MTEFEVRTLAEENVGALVKLADQIWHEHYADIISPEQIDYMLAQRYQPEIICMSLEKDCWLGAWQGERLVAFAHALAEPVSRSWRLDKLYVHEDFRRQGVGKALLSEVMGKALGAGAERLTLRVNKRNRLALAAYARYGFKLYGEDMLNIGNGFVMDDYLLELKPYP